MGPGTIIGCIVFLYQILGWRYVPTSARPLFSEMNVFNSAFVGLAWLLIIVPLPGYVAARVRTVQKIALKNTDVRVGTVTESEYRIL